MDRVFTATAWAGLTVAFLYAARRWKLRDLEWQSYALAAMAFARCWASNFYSPEQFASFAGPVLVGATVIAALFAAMLLCDLDSRPRLYFSVLASSLLAVLLYFQISGSHLTIAWGVEGIALLAAGFPLRDRVLRLSGIALLMFCILKLFFFDLRHLETLPRILSFMVLGLILVAVSWVYTRFRDVLMGQVLDLPHKAGGNPEASMKLRVRFLVVLGMLVLSTVVAALLPGGSDVSLASVRQLWSDTVRDADQPGLRLTRLSAAEEMKLGNQLVATIPWTQNQALEQQVARVARPMLPYLHRREIVYTAHVVNAPVINAFALPGGHVVVTDALLNFVQSDSELAEVMGHEMAHVDLRHAVERYQYEYRLGALVEIFHRLAALPYSADQELDADAEGMRLAIAAGYDPAAGAALFERMRKEFHESAKTPDTTPAGEIAHSLGDALASYFRSHPPTGERARRLRDLANAAQAHRGR